ncbi:phage tail assembly chaperone [uncultured Parasphingorhabdus sp.]|uniref:phage tail assembly chaperone n=1 Tax=uncultured Parasphingorhabdus sp. TaxID=2709694 RepID=UPI0030D7DF70|tara:strand:+ start:2272 stop:2484 length:213 start_codon:yes stop_codon:yes gene_type:complete
MADNFSTSAARLAGLVPLILGWTPDQFWHATPEELASLFRSLEGHAIGGDPALPLDQSTFAILKEAFPDG